MTETRVRYRLGAEELIELGNGKVGVNLDRKPFLADRTKNVRLELGSSRIGARNIIDALSNVAEPISDRLTVALDTLSKVVGMPLGVFAQNSDTVAEKVSKMSEKVPALDSLLVQILLLGGSLAKFGLSTPGLLLRQLGNVLGGIGRALQGRFNESQIQDKINEAKREIVERSPNGQKDEVSRILNAIGVTGEDLTPNVNHETGQVVPSEPVGAGTLGSAIPGAFPPPAAGRTDLAKVLAVGVPVAGVAALLAALS